MDNASSSSAPDLAEEFQRSIVANRKRNHEDNVLDKTQSTWFKLQDFQLYREVGLPLRGPVATRILVALEKKYQRCLAFPQAADVFKGEGVYLLKLYKEQKVIKKIAFSDDFEKFCTGGMGT